MTATATQKVATQKTVIKKYCRACTQKLTELDGAYWKFDNRCVMCRINAGFAKHGLPPLPTK